jgi:hypothetical protein
MAWKSGDGVSSGLDFDLMLDGKDISEPPKSDFPCVENITIGHKNLVIIRMTNNHTSK